MIFAIADKQTNLSSLIFGGELHIHIYNKRISETPFLLISPILLNFGSQLISRAWWNAKLRRGIHMDLGKACYICVQAKVFWKMNIFGHFHCQIGFSFVYLTYLDLAKHNKKGSLLFLYSTKKNPSTWIRILILLLNINSIIIKGIYQHKIF